MRLAAVLPVLLLVAGLIPADAMDLHGHKALDQPAKGQELSQMMGEHYTMNKGQIPHEEVLYHSENAYFTSSGVIFRATGAGPATTMFSVFSMGFVGANPSLPEGRSQLRQPANFFLGADPARWCAGVPSFGEIVYEEVYDGIDVAFRSVPEGTKYEFRLSPGSDIEQIALKFTGASPSTAGSTLCLRTPTGTVLDSGLLAYQTVKGEVKEVGVRMLVTADLVTYEADYDPQLPLVIDPLVQSTFLGGGSGEYPMSMALDASNNTYITGYTSSIDFPTTPGVYGSASKGGQDIFVSKLNSDCTGLIYSTYIGGSRSDYPFGMALDVSGNAYLAGYTQSTDFPTTPDAYDKVFNGTSDAILVILNSSGSGLLYSTYLGGNEYDGSSGIALDSSGIYITGYTSSRDFPVTAGAYDTALAGGYDIFIMKANLTTRSIVYSTYVGCGNTDLGASITVDASGSAYVSGRTDSRDFPVTGGAYDTTYNGGNDDIFVLKLNAGGSGLSYCTYIGGNNNDLMYYPPSMALDASNNVYLVGDTMSSDFPTTAGAWDDELNGTQDGALVKLDSSGSKLLYSGYVGGRDDYDRATAIALDISGNVYLTGKTGSTDFPLTPDAYSVKLGDSSDAFVMKLNSSCTGIKYSSFLGGTSTDQGQAVGVDASKFMRVGGSTSSSDFPVTKDAYDGTYNGGGDAFICMLGPTAPFAPRNLTASLGDAYVRLNWSAPRIDGDSAITDYLVYRGDAANNLSLAGKVGVVLGVNDTGLKNGAIYFYAVSAKNAIGEGPQTGTLKAIPGAPPTQPGNLSAVASDHRVDLSWDRPTDDKGFPVTRYHVYRRAGAAPPVMLETAANETRYTDYELVNGMMYNYSVAAINARGEGNRSNSSNAVPWSAPSAPADLTIKSGSRSAEIEWRAPADDGGFGIAGYRIYSGADPDQLTFACETTDTMHNFTSLMNGQGYYFSVSAFSTMGEGPQTGPVFARPSSVPHAPVLTAIGGFGSIRLNWTLADDGGLKVVGCELYKGTNADQLGLLASVFGNDWVDTEVVNREYYYSVLAVNYLGKGSMSATVSAHPKTGAGEGVPGAPTALTASGGPEAISLQWMPPEDTGGLPIMGYIVLRGENENELAALANSTLLEFNDSTALIGVTYYYSVSAVNARGTGPSCPALAASLVGEGGVPSTPNKLVALAGDGCVRLEWQAPAALGGYPIMKYRLYRGYAEYAFKPYQDIIGNAYVDADVANGQTYRYAISAMNARGEGGRTEVVTARPAGLPGPVLSLRCIEGNGYLKLDWNAPTSNGGLPVTAYIIHRSGTTGDISMNSSLDEFNDTAVLNGQTYRYKVAATNELGEGPAIELSAIPGALPMAPSGMKARVEGGAVALSWAPPADYGGLRPFYRIYRGVSGGPMSPIAETMELGYLDNEVRSGQNCTYQVSAVNAKGEGDLSAPARVTLPPAATGVRGGEAYDAGIYLLAMALTLGAAAGAAALIFGRRPGNQPTPQAAVLADAPPAGAEAAPAMPPAPKEGG